MQVGDETQFQLDGRDVDDGEAAVHVFLFFRGRVSTE